MNRQEYRKIRAGLTQTQREVFSKRVCRAIIETDEYKRARRIMAYWAIGEELSLKELIYHALAEGKEVYLPVCHEDGIMEGALFEGEDKLIMGACRVPEPVGRTISPENLQLILVPMLAFNDECYRTGWGKGYYDRYLIRTGGYSLGVAFDCQYDGQMQVKGHDVALNKIITEDKVYLGKESNS